MPTPGLRAGPRSVRPEPQVGGHRGGHQVEEGDDRGAAAGGAGPGRGGEGLRRSADHAERAGRGAEGEVRRAHEAALRRVQR